jgi:myo-inositol-1(or 4)-monophosphatase
MSDPLASELDFAVELAVRAGHVLVERFGNLDEGVHKGPHDVVTEADTASERLIIAAIEAAYPADDVLAEESGSTKGRAGSRRTWVIDPLDGTVNYANGIPLFSVSIALVIDGRPQVGVVRDPILEETYAAAAEMPATLNGRLLQVRDKTLLSDCVVSVSLVRRLGTRTAATSRAFRANRDIGSAALELAWVAAGRLDAFAHSGGLSVWDVAAGGLIAHQAGATVAAIEPGTTWFELDPTRLAHGIVAAGPSVYRSLMTGVRDREPVAGAS